MPLLNVIIFCLFFATPCFKAFAQDQTALQLLQTVQPSLVEVRAINTKTFIDNNGHTRTASYHAQGSGIIIDSHGTIVTNTHIITNAAQILVGLSDGTILEAKLVYSSDADFSFLKVDPPYPLTTITWADPATAQEGTNVITLSNTDDEHQHVLGGAITGLIYGASSSNVEAFEFNIPLYHGDSGGPLLDDQGHLLGLIMGKQLDHDNKSYAIASDKIRQEYQRYTNDPQG
jgi:serine protease Do